MLKILKHTLFALVLIVGVSLATFAQSNDNRNTQPPPKKDQPVVPVEPKKENPPKGNTPNNDNSNKPKKPTLEFSGNMQTITLVIA